MAESPKATERQARTPLPPQKESPFKRPRMQILLLILGLLAANYLFVAIFAPGGPEPVRIPYSPTFLQQVRDGNVERVSTQGETVDGIFKKEFKYRGRRAHEELRHGDPDVRAGQRRPQPAARGRRG